MPGRRDCPPCRASNALGGGADQHLCLCNLYLVAVACVIAIVMAEVLQKAAENERIAANHRWVGDCDDCQAFLGLFQTVA